MLWLCECVNVISKANYHGGVSYPFCPLPCPYVSRFVKGEGFLLTCASDFLPITVL